MHWEWPIPFVSRDENDQPNDPVQRKLYLALSQSTDLDHLTS